LARIIKIRNGLDIPIPGSPEQSIHPGPDVKHVALCGPDYVGLRARLLVAKGEPVGLGQPLFIDKNDPAVPHCSPGTGHVVAINRGARRALESVVVRLADRATAKKLFEPLASEEIHALDAQAVAGRVQQSGLWTAFRTRPFSRVPFSDSRPSSIFVTAMDTRPLSADPVVVIEGEANAFMTGLQLMGKLTGGSVYLCTAAQSGIEAPGIDRLRHAEFHGPHPAGLPGTHIHHLEPAGARRVAWHIGYQDVIAIGKLFSTGVLDTGRIIALGGEGIETPRLLATRLGASTDELLAGNVLDLNVGRVISGSVLEGRTARDTFGFLGRYHLQVCVIREGGARHIFGWTGLFPRHYTAASTLLRKTRHKRMHAFTTAQNGRFSGMIPMRAFEKVIPLDILPSSLFRALLVRDTDQAQALGCLELDEEDLALCSFVCPAKYDYGSMLRSNLDQIEKGG
jgi:Na+-transporting NADH:ubiquinone oxidoreductase subunit A